MKQNYRQVFYLGLGLNNQAELGTLRDCIRGFLALAKAAGGDGIAAIATIEKLVPLLILHEIAADLAIGDVFYFSPRRLEVETPRLAKPSKAVFKAVGCHGVAEAAALAAAGEGGELAIEKTTYNGFTLALALKKISLQLGKTG